MRSRTLLAAGCCFLLAMAVAVVGITRAAGSASGATTADESTGTKATESEAVERRDLVEREQVTGDLGYAEARAVSSPRQGTVTETPELGDVIDRGESLFTVDDREVPLLFGTVPMWRSLSAASTDGPDVRQLEENLVALGFASADDLTVDEHFDAATQAAVVRWQESLGITANGVVDKTDLVFQPGAVRVASIEATVGSQAQPGQPALKVTGTERLVTVKLEVAEAKVAHEGDAVRIDLGGGTVLDGTVRSVGKVATTDSQDQSGDAKITVLVALDDPSATGDLDEAPAKVSFTTDAALDVLAVPVEALLALSEGGYAVEVSNGSSTHLVGVDLGAFADGWVQITGDVAEGDQVVVAR